MEHRRCPKCGTIWHSADPNAWKCERCGTVITAKNNVAEVTHEIIRGGLS